MRNFHQAIPTLVVAVLLTSGVSGQEVAPATIAELPAVERGFLLADAGDDAATDPLMVEEPVMEGLLSDDPEIEEPDVDDQVPAAEASDLDGPELEDPVVDIPSTGDAGEAPAPDSDPLMIEEPMDAPGDEPATIAIDAPAPGPSPVVTPSDAPVIAPHLAELRDEIDVMIKSEKLKRRAYSKHLHDTLSAGSTALTERRYEDAITIYEEALRLIKSIGDRPEDRTEKEAAIAGLAEALYRRAVYLEGQGDLDEAAELARRAVGRGHEMAPELISRITELQKDPPPPPAPKVQPRWHQQEYVEESDELSKLLMTGREHYVAGELERARIMFETILSRDPENTEAIRMLQKVADRTYDAATAEMITTRRGMIADVRRNFNPRDYELSAEKKIMEDIFEVKQTQVTDNDRQRILEKMRNIRIPEIDFRQANIHDVIDFLQDASVEFDETEEGETTDEERGVNIILNLSAGQDQGPEETETADPFAAVTGETKEAGDEVPLITFSARYISLHEALKIVTDVASLKFRVSGEVVMVLRHDAPEDLLIHRMYDVLPSVGEKIEMVAPALRGGGRGGGGGGDFIALEGTGVTTARSDWKDFFENLGVSWPRGSSIKFIPAIGKIVVKNTPENLTIFESVLGVLNVVPYQIEIESRFVEVAQDDLNSLGFEWNLTDDWEVAQKEDSSGSYGSRQRISVSSGSFSSGLRYATDESPDGTGITASDNILTMASVLTNPEVEFVLHALEQRGNTDLLSSPKVTTQSGLEATLKVVKEYIYPTAFDVEGIGGSSNNDNQDTGNVGAVVQPEDFETREVGVILSVLPEVSPEGQMINLTMSPEVVSEPEWFNYGSTYTDENGEVQELNMPQPFFRSRSIQTSISIYNGATVVMGGLITEARSTVEDKIPLLGDIPLIGRLFQSSMEDSQKRNLLIFVTARLVDPSGRPVKQSGDSAGEDRIEEALMESEG